MSSMVESAKARLIDWGLTHTVACTRGDTVPEIVERAFERTSWLRGRMPVGNGPTGPWHIIETDEHAVYGFRDADTAFEFKLRFA